MSSILSRSSICPSRLLKNQIRKLANSTNFRTHFGGALLLLEAAMAGNISMISRVSRRLFGVFQQPARDSLVGVSACRAESGGFDPRLGRHQGVAYTNRH